MIVISDTSAMSCFAEMGELDLLREMLGVVTITETVAREATSPGSPEILRQAVMTGAEWIQVVPDLDYRLEEVSGLDAGEASAITLAWEHRRSCLLVIDERRGRKIAEALGLRIIGVAGILNLAAQQGRIDFDDAFRRLAESSFHLSQRIVEQLRRQRSANQ